MDVIKKILVFYWLSLGACTLNAETIMVLGDSISAAYKIPVESGWVNLLKRKVENQWPGQYLVVNASISGDTTAGGLSRLPLLLDEYQPDRVIVELGGNDGLRGLSLKQVKLNLQSIIDLCNASNAEVILIEVQLPKSYGAYFNQRFSGVFEQLADTNNLVLVSIGYDLLASRDLIQADGIHPTQAAQPLLLEALWPQLNIN